MRLFALKPDGKNFVEIFGCLSAQGVGPAGSFTIGMHSDEDIALLPLPHPKHALIPQPCPHLLTHPYLLQRLCSPLSSCPGDLQLLPVIIFHTVSISPPSSRCHCRLFPCVTASFRRHILLQDSTHPSQLPARPFVQPLYRKLFKLPAIFLIK